MADVTYTHKRPQGTDPVVIGWINPGKIRIEAKMEGFKDYYCRIDGGNWWGPWSADRYMSELRKPLNDFLANMRR